MSSIETYEPTVLLRATEDLVLTGEQEVSSFFEANPPTGGGRTVQLAVEGIDANIEWVANNSESVCLWLRSRSSSK